MGLANAVDVRRPSGSTDARRGEERTGQIAENSPTKLGQREIRILNN